MSDIVLSASVRQNLLSLQSTADLLATTQNRLSTGNKVNTALDNPTNYFTAQSLNNRSSDINNLLDGVSNGVQVLQAANTGITSLQKLIDSAKSVANQALQAAVGYSTKSTITTGVIAGATADNLLGAASYGDATATAGSAVTSNTLGAFTTANALGTALTTTVTGSPTNAAAAAGAELDSDALGAKATGSTLLTGLFSSGGIAIDLNSKTLTVGSATITFSDSAGAAITGAGTNAITVGTGATLDDLAGVIDAANGNTTDASAFNATTGKLELNTGTASDLALGGTALADLGLPASTSRTPGAVTHPAATASTALSALDAAPADASTLSINGKTITFSTGTATTSPPSAAGGTVNLGTGTLGDVVAAINAITGAASASVDGTGKISIDSGTASTLTVGAGASGHDASTALGLGAVVTHGAYGTAGAPTTPAVTGATLLSGSASTTSNSLTTAFSASDTIVVNNKTITFSTSSATNTSASGGVVNITSGSVQDVLDAIDKITGTNGTANASSIDATTGAISLHTGSGSDLVTSGSGLAKLGLVGGTTARTATGGLTGKTLTIGATGNGTTTTINFGTASGNVKSLNDLNNALAANNLQASLDTSNHLIITTTNDAASFTIGAVGGTATDAGNPFTGVSAGSAPVQDQSALLNRSNLVSQYNNILDQIRTTAQDASFNGIDLLNGDQLKLTFNETGTSTLKIQGVNFSPDGLGLSPLTGGTDFLDNSSANKALSALDKASGTLRTEASALGSNLSIVQIRQDFSKNLINVLQTGASNLTLADTNEEAANSQALSTRQSIAVSALALANQSQQSVLQLLR